MERAPARTFQDLIVWQKSHSLVLAVYRLSCTSRTIAIVWYSNCLKR